MNEWMKRAVDPRPVATVVAAAALCLLSGVVFAQEPLSITAAIDTTRAMVDQSMNAVFPSQDGKRYVVMLIRGDTKRNGVWADMLAGDLTSLSTARPKIIASLFTSGLGAHGGMGEGGGAPQLLAPWLNVPVWLDSEHVGLRWEDGTATAQVVSISVKDGSVHFLTKSSGAVMSFARTGLGALLYEASIRYPRDASEAMLKHGFAVTSPDAIPLLAGYVDGAAASDFGNCERYAVVPGFPDAVRLASGTSVFCQTSFLAAPPGRDSSTLSPDGRWVLLNVSADSIPPSWRRYTQDDLESLLRVRDRSPKHLYTKLIQSLYIADLRTGESKPLWDAPLNRRKPLNISWGSGSSAIIWPTFVPITHHSDEAALDGRAIAEIDVETGKWRQIPMDSVEASEIQSVNWQGSSMCEVTTSSGRILRFTKIAGEWKLSRSGPSSARVGTYGRSVPQRTTAAVKVELRQSITVSPRLYARDVRSGKEVEIHDLNPRFGREISLSTPEFVHWEDAAGRRWKGRFYPPLEIRPGQRSPLVVQTHGYAGVNEFSIYGPGDGATSLGPGWSVYLAQPLAAQGIAVLQVGGPENSADDITEFERLRQAEAGISAAVEHLVDRRMIDRERVGIMGHSATGRHVEHLLAFSSFQFAAAIAGDYADGNYVQSALYGWPDFGAEANGALPFAEGLSSWLEHSPAFNAQHIRTPLQINLTSSSEGFGTLLWGWEIFSRLRYLGKPVEYYVIPDFRRGSHTLQNPRQLLALQTRALDWWCFWLKDESSDDPAKAAQYASWRAMRAQHETHVSSDELRRTGTRVAQQPNQKAISAP